MDEKAKMENAFSDFNPGDHGANGCTPAIDGDFVGVKINGPGEITLPAERSQAMIPLCGVYRLRFDYIVTLGSPEEHMSIIVVHQESQKSYAGRILSGDPILADPNQAPKNIEGQGESFETGYFDINLLDYVSFPLVPGNYHLYVVLEEYKSNVIHLTLKK